MSSLRLTGLDAQNPLAFFAALGLLRVVDWHARETGAERPRLSFVEEGTCIPVLRTELSLEEVIGVVLADAAAQAANPALQFAYDKGGAWVSPSEPDAKRELKPSLAAVRAFHDSIATANPRVSRLAAAWFSELIQAGASKSPSKARASTDDDDSTERAKPTVFHFCARTNYFLDIAEKLRRDLDAEQLREALKGPWLRTSNSSSLGWDATVGRSTALRALSRETLGSTPAANWLGVLAMEFFPVAPSGKHLVTTGVSGSWNEAVFAWPLWRPPSTAATVSSLLRIDATTWTGAERAALGISTVFASPILRVNQGEGSFCPARVVLPPSPRRERRGAQVPT